MTARTRPWPSIDTGVDSLVPNFRGRVATGFSTFSNGFGNDDTAAAGNGHGTLVAGVIAQFVPQATLNPVNVFTPNQVVPGPGGLNLGQRHLAAERLPRVRLRRQEPVRPKDPVRSEHAENREDRRVNRRLRHHDHLSDRDRGRSSRFPQVTIAFKNEFKKFRDAGHLARSRRPVSSVPRKARASPRSRHRRRRHGHGLPGRAQRGHLCHRVVSLTPTSARPTATPPIDPGSGVVIPRPARPAAALRHRLDASATTLNGVGTAAVVAAGDQSWSSRTSCSRPRIASLTTDYTAPELDIPSFVADGQRHAGRDRRRLDRRHGRQRDLRLQ